MFRCTRRSLFAAAGLAGLAALAPAVRAGDGCAGGTGSDLLGADVYQITRWGSVDGVTAYTMGSTVCNIGTDTEPFDATGTDHPVIATNMYRIHDGRFEQIGMSWLKHTFGAAAQSFCCPCRPPGTITILGVGCSDPYGPAINAEQAGHGNPLVGGLGPRTEVNPVTGGFTFPYTGMGQSGDAIFRRLQVRQDDLDPGQYPGARYFGEGHFVGPADAAAGNGANNMSHREIQVGPLFADGYQLDFLGASVQGAPAIAAWAAIDPEVSLTTVDVPGDGRFVLGQRCTDNGDGTWHYEYALYNMNSHRAARRFAVPADDGMTVTNIGFTDVAYHSGEMVDGLDWTGVHSGGEVAWTCAATGATANALRWGTAYSFRFDADRAPVPASAEATLFMPGVPATIAVDTCGPMPQPLPGDVNQDGTVGIDDVVAVVLAWGPCPPGPVPCPADLDGSLAVDVDDLVLVVLGWTGP